MLRQRSKKASRVMKVDAAQYFGFDQSCLWQQQEPAWINGFDIVIGSVEDPQQRGYWFGDPPIEEDTSGFGSLIIEEKRAP
jgi:hypothetical protein